MSNDAAGRVLVAEDEDYLREALEVFLNSKGYEAKTVPNGRLALEELRRGDYDLLITDISMPEMTGEELIEALAGDASVSDKPPVIFMTAHGTLESAIKGISAGVSAYIRKPLNFHEMEAAIRTAIHKKRLERELASYYGELDRLVEERTRELSILYSFSEVINRSFDLDVILRDAMDNLTRSLETDAAWIYLYEDDGSTLTLKAQKGFSKEFAASASRIGMEDGYKGVTFRDGGAFIYNGAAPTSLPISQGVLREGFRTAMHAAVKSGERLLGTMGVASKAGKDFEGSHLKLLTSFGHQIGVAIEKTRLLEREKAASRDLEKMVNQLFIINLMGGRARVSNNLNETCDILVSSIIQALGFDNVCIWLYDESGKKLDAAACQGVMKYAGPTSVEGASLARLFGSGGEAAITTSSFCRGLMERQAVGGDLIAMAPLVTRDPDTREVDCWDFFECAFAACPAYKKAGLSCWMIAGSCMSCHAEKENLFDKMERCRRCPVYQNNTRGRVIGVICADNTSSGRLIMPDDIKVLNIFANTAATIVDNINLMERLIKNDRFIDGIIANMATGLMVLDPDGRIKLINLSGAQIFGYGVSDMTGRKITELFPETADMLEVERSSIGHEITLGTRNGPVPVGFTNSHLIDHAGRSEGVIALFRDLSEIKKLQAELREKDHFAAIGKVAAGVAHEIRNPLFGITSVAQILAREITQDNPKKPLIDAMLSETSRLNTLVEDMLLYGRSMKLSPQPVDLNSLIDSVLTFHQAGFKEKELLVEKVFDEGLPEAMVDPGQLRQVFLNLIVNAMDASDFGSILRAETGRTGGGAVIRITDHGIGIPREDLPKVFDLFYTTKEKGTGLGLAICRKIIEDHGGSVHIQSVPGKGTTVELELPLADAGERTFATGREREDVCEKT